MNETNYIPTSKIDTSYSRELVYGGTTTYDNPIFTYDSLVIRYNGQVPIDQATVPYQKITKQETIYI